MNIDFILYTYLHIYLYIVYEIFKVFRSFCHWLKKAKICLTEICAFVYVDYIILNF